MPNLKEATVAVVGQIMDVERLSNFETKKFDGLRVVLATGDGFASVKVALDDVADVQAEPYARVAWVVRYGAWARGENAQTTCRFIRVANENDLDMLHSVIAAPAGAGK